MGGSCTPCFSHVSSGSARAALGLLVLCPARADAWFRRAEWCWEDDGDALVFGLVELDGGEVFWDGRPVGLSERLRFGYIPEERGPYPRMPVGEQLAYFGSLHGLDEGAARTAAARWLERLDLGSRRREARSLHPTAASSSRRRCCTSRSCSSSTSPSRGSTRSRSKRSPRCSVARLPAMPPPLFQPSTRARPGHLRGSRDYRPWPDRRTGLLDRSAGLAAAPDQLQLEGAPPTWVSDVAGVELVGDATATCGFWPAGTSTRSRCLPPQKGRGGCRVQLRPAVARGALPGAGGVDERPARDRARCPAEIRERLRSKAFLSRHW